MKEIQTLIKTKQNQKWKIQHKLLKRRTLRFSSYKNFELLIISSLLKVKLWWAEARERKRIVFFSTFIFSEGIFFNICVLSHCRVYWKNFLKICTFTYKKHINSYTFLHISKSSKAFSVPLIICFYQFHILQGKVIQQVNFSRWLWNLYKSYHFKLQTVSLFKIVKRVLVKIVLVKIILKVVLIFFGETVSKNTWTGNLSFFFSLILEQYKDVGNIGDTLEAVVRRCSVKKFLIISHNSKKSTCARVYFLIKFSLILEHKTI